MAGGLTVAHGIGPEADSKVMKLYRKGLASKKQPITMSTSDNVGLILDSDGVSYKEPSKLVCNLTAAKGEDKWELQFEEQENHIVSYDIRIVAHTTPDAQVPDITTVDTDCLELIDGIYDSFAQTVGIDSEKGVSRPQLPEDFSGFGIFSPLNGVYPVMPNPLSTPLEGWYEPYLRSIVVFAVSAVGVTIAQQVKMYITLPGLGFRDRVFFYRVYWRRTLIAAASAGALAYFAPRITTHIEPQQAQGLESEAPDSDDEYVLVQNPP